MLAAGTVVTGTGPLAGTVLDASGHRKTVPRFHFPLENVTQLHADIGWFIGALAVALVIGLRFSPAPRQAVRFSVLVLVGLAIQGVVGYTQYFSHLPAGLVWVHVASSVVLWIFVLRLYLATRERTAPPGRASRRGPAAPAAPAASRRGLRRPRLNRPSPGDPVPRTPGACEGIKPGNFALYRDKSPKLVAIMAKTSFIPKTFVAYRAKSLRDHE